MVVCNYDQASTPLSFFQPLINTSETDFRNIEIEIRNKLKF